MKVYAGSLVTVNQEIYPSLGGWFVQIWLASDPSEVVARAYGHTPDQARERAEMIVKALSAPIPEAF